MTLDKNQIRTLYVWVHPGNDDVGKLTLECWRGIIEVLQYEPRIGLLELSNVAQDGIAWNKHPTYNGESLEGNEGCLPWFSRVPYGERIKDSENHPQRYRKIADIEELAKNLLGERFHHWPHGNFVDGQAQPHIDYIKELFNVEERLLFPWKQDKKLFSEINCYGLRPDACVLWQTYDFCLHNLAHELNNLGIGDYSDLNCIIHTTYKIFEGDKTGYYEGVPSTIESLDVMVKKGIPKKLFWDGGRVRDMKQRLMHFDNPKAKGIIFDPWRKERK